MLLCILNPLHPTSQRAQSRPSIIGFTLASTKFHTKKKSEQTHKSISIQSSLRTLSRKGAGALLETSHGIKVASSRLSMSKIHAGVGHIDLEAEIYRYSELQCYILQLRSAEFVDLALEIFYSCICVPNQAAQRCSGSLLNCIGYCAKIRSATCVKWSRILCSKCREGAASFLERVPAKSAPLEWHLLLQNGHMPGPHSEAS